MWGKERKNVCERKSRWAGDGNQRNRVEDRGTVVGVWSGGTVMSDGERAPR